MQDRESLIPLFKEYKNNGGIVSPMNTESCKRYLQKKVGCKIEPEREKKYAKYKTAGSCKF